MTTYFISDLHLDSSRPWVVDALQRFLDERRDAEALYILGDLFEFWVGDDDDSNLAAQIAEILQDYSASGPSLYLMHGNRDFLIGTAFAERVGARLLDDPHLIHLDTESVLLSHGDVFCTRDVEYQAFRQQARSAQWQAQILAQSLDARRAIAEQLRQASMDAGSRKAEDIMDVTESEVLACMQDSATHALIHGHTHRPQRHDNEAGVRWVLGDWDHSGWYLRHDAGHFDLVEFPIVGAPGPESDSAST